MQKRELSIIAALVVLSTALLYLSIAATRLTNANYGSDGGDLLAAVLTQGVPHPTGYPSYILLGIIFQFIPISTPVFRAVLASLIPASLAAGLLTGWIGHMIRSSTFLALSVSALTGIAWGIAPILFSQAVIIEVHGLQALVVVSVLWWITLNLEYAKGTDPKWLLGLSFLIGLGVGNHLTILLLAPVGLLALALMVRRSRSWRLLFAQISLTIAGMLVYVYLPIRAQAYPAINWGNPQTWQGFFWETGAVPYRTFLFSASPMEVVERIRSTTGLLMDQFGALGLVAGIIGMIQYQFVTKWLRWGLIWIFLVFFTFTVIYNARDSMVYIIPAVMVYAIWIGLACLTLWELKWKHFPVGSVLVGVLAISILIRVPATLTRLDPRSQDQPASYAEQLMDTAPFNAIVYTSSDEDSFPLWYYHFGLKERSDLRIVVLPLTQFVWYQQNLVHIYPSLQFPPVYSQDLPNADWGKQIALLNPELPVCNTRLSSESQTGISYQCSTP